jgi:carbon monoxide dehydrogenase subunit G
MSEVHARIDIAAPPQHVWAIVMDPRRLAEWVTIHRRLGHAPSAPACRGDEMEQTLSLHGVRFRVRWELETCDEPSHAIWIGHGPARSHAETEYTLHAAADGGTRFDYRNEFRAPLGPLGALASRAIVGGLPQREADASLAKLKALVERS